jgi:hypothetical protein
VARMMVALVATEIAIADLVPVPRHVDTDIGYSNPGRGIVIDPTANILYRRGSSHWQNY